MIELKLPWMSYYMQKANFLLQIVFEILEFKKLCNLIGLEHFQLQLKISTKYHLKPKNDGQNLSSKSVLPIFFRAIRARLSKPKENDQTVTSMNT